MNELLLIIAMIIFGTLACISEPMFRGMVIVALVCIFYEIPRR